MSTNIVGYEQKGNNLGVNILTAAYIENFRLNENKNYKVTIINKGEGRLSDQIEPAKEILEGKIINQHRYVFIFECISRNKFKKRVCINKIDYLIKSSLIKECK